MDFEQFEGFWQQVVRERLGGLEAMPISVEPLRVRQYFDLRDALAASGCPICVRVLSAGDDMLRRLLEHSSSRDNVRNRSLASRGLCGVHAWRIERTNLPVGLAEAYETFLQGQLEKLQSATVPPRGRLRSIWAQLSGWRRRRQCPACRAGQVMEQRDIRLLLDLITDMEFSRAFERSAGLCLPHLALALGFAPTHPNRPKLVEAHIPKIKHLQADLQDYIRREKAPIQTLSSAERDAVWTRILEWTAGKAGTFGHHRDLAPDGAGMGGILSPLRRGVRKAPRSGTEGAGNSQSNEPVSLRLENAKLQRRLIEVSREWAEESARRAALQYQIHKLSEDVKVLELNLAGARGETKSGVLHAEHLREEI
jgi:hypothetical protein